MKKIKLILLSMVVFAGTTVFAQEQKLEEQQTTSKQTLSKQTLTKEQRMEKLAKELDLTEEQAEQMGKVNEAYSTEISKVRSDESLSDEAKKEAMRSLRMEQQANVAEILTEEQNQKLKEIKENAKAKHLERRKVEQHSIKQEHKVQSTRKVQKDVSPADKKTKQTKPLEK